MLLSGEKYLTAIYRLKQQGGRVRSVEVARYLGYTRPSVCRVISAFENDGYLFREKGGILTLTKEGNDLAGRIVRRQDTIAGFLSEKLAYSTIESGQRSTMLVMYGTLYFFAILYPARHDRGCGMAAMMISGFLKNL